MDIQEIEVTIDKNGQVTIQVRGVNGIVCLEMTKDLETALGNQLEEREMQAETLNLPDIPSNDKVRISSKK